MPRRRVRLWALWLLPLIAARAFLPVGFMLAFQGGHAGFVLCPDQTPGIVAQLDGHSPAVHVHGQHFDAHAAHAASHGAGIEPPCIFGVAAAAISLDVPALAGVEPRPQTYSPSFDSTFQPGIGPDRADRIRGPPQLS